MRKFNIIPIIILLAIFVVLSNKLCRLLGEYWTITCLDIDWLISLHSILFYFTCLIGSIITCLYQVLVSCSPSFCTPTGYSKKEVIGKNCRFLQVPAGQVSKGDVRRFTSQDTVAYLTKSSMADKECQTSIVNYEKKWRHLRRSGRHYPRSWWCRWQFWWTRRYCLSNWIPSWSFCAAGCHSGEIEGWLLYRWLCISFVSVPPSKFETLPQEKKVNTFSPVVVSKELKRLMFVAYNDIRNSPILWCDVFYRRLKYHSTPFFASPGCFPRFHPRLFSQK